MIPTKLQISLIEKEAENRYPKNHAFADRLQRHIAVQRTAYKAGCLSTLEKQGNEAVEFAEWIRDDTSFVKNCDGQGGWYDMGEFKKHGSSEIFTTQELYDLFIQSKNK